MERTVYQIYGSERANIREMDPTNSESPYTNLSDFIKVSHIEKYSARQKKNVFIKLIQKSSSVLLSYEYLLHWGKFFRTIALVC